ncbi:hypothetical protein GC163_15300 [bacterium]|nr:hypothetical protein [bacterium]
MSAARPFSLSISMRFCGRRLRWRLNRQQLQNRTLLCAAAVCALLGSYIMGVIPIALLLNITGLYEVPLVEHVFAVVYAPIVWAYENIEWVENFYDGYQELLAYLLNLS